MQNFSRVVTSTTAKLEQGECLIDLARQGQYSLRSQYRALSYPTFILTIPEFLIRCSPNDYRWIPLVKKGSETEESTLFIVKEPKIHKNVKALQTEDGRGALYVTLSKNEDFKFKTNFQKKKIKGAKKAVVSECPIFRLRSFELIPTPGNTELDSFIFAMIPRGKTADVATKVNHIIANFFNLPQIQGESKEDYIARIRNTLNQIPSMTELTHFFSGFCESENNRYCQGLSKKRHLEELYASEQEFYPFEQELYPSEHEAELSFEPQRKKHRVEDYYGDIPFTIEDKAIDNEIIGLDQVRHELLSPDTNEILNSIGDTFAKKYPESIFVEPTNNPLDDQAFSVFSA